MTHATTHVFHITRAWFDLQDGTPRLRVAVAPPVVVTEFWSTIAGHTHLFRRIVDTGGERWFEAVPRDDAHGPIGVPTFELVGPGRAG